MEVSKKSRNKDLVNQILQLLTISGGMTPDEIALAIQVDVLYIRPRVTELKKAGKIYTTGERRKNAKGRNPKVVAIDTRPKIAEW